MVRLTIRNQAFPWSRRDWYQCPKHSEIVWDFFFWCQLLDKHRRVLQFLVCSIQTTVPDNFGCSPSPVGGSNLAELCNLRNYREHFFELIWHTTPPVTKIGEYMKKQSPHLSVSKFRRICDFESICNVQSQQAVSRLRTLHSVEYSNIYHLANFMTATPVNTSFESP